MAEYSARPTNRLDNSNQIKSNQIELYYLRIHTVHWNYDNKENATKTNISRKENKYS
jgi:hypothetical protein